MFEVGDKIFYPMHGAGTIDAIEEKEVLGSKQLYYIISFKNLKVMLPIESNVGVRELSPLDTVEDVMSVFNEEISDVALNPTQRFRSNMNKMKSGDIYQGAQVIRDLSRISKKSNLSTGEKNMLDNAIRVLTSELVLVKGIAQEQAFDILQGVISN